MNTHINVSSDQFYAPAPGIQDMDRALFDNENSRLDDILKNRDTLRVVPLTDEYKKSYLAASPEWYQDSNVYLITDDKTNILMVAIERGGTLGRRFCRPMNASTIDFFPPRESHESEKLFSAVKPFGCLTCFGGYCCNARVETHSAPTNKLMGVTSEESCSGLHPTYDVVVDKTNATLVGPGGWVSNMRKFDTQTFSYSSKESTLGLIELDTDGGQYKIKTVDPFHRPLSTTEKVHLLSSVLMLDNQFFDRGYILGWHLGTLYLNGCVLPVICGPPCPIVMGNRRPKDTHANLMMSLFAN